MSYLDGDLDCRPKRATRATWKLKDELEHSLWEHVDHVETLQHDVLEHRASRTVLQKARADLIHMYDGYRDAVAIVPADLRQAVDRVIGSSFGGNRSHGGSSSGSSSRAVLSLRAEQLKKEVDAQKEAAQERAQIARLEAELVLRRESVKIRETEEKLRRMEAKLQLMEADGHSSDSLGSESHRSGSDVQHQIRTEPHISALGVQHQIITEPHISASDVQQQVMTQVAQAHRLESDAMKQTSSEENRLPSDKKQVTIDQEPIQQSNIVQNAMYQYPTENRKERRGRKDVRGVALEPSGIDPTKILTHDPMSTLAETLSQAFLNSRVPLPEPKVFNGDPLEFTAWKTSFDALICARKIPKKEQSYFLQRYLGGEAKECVQGLFNVNEPDSFTKAYDLLQKRYGNPFIIAESFRGKLEKWKGIGNDPKDLRKFSDFLNQCVVMLDHNKSLSVLNDPHENKKMLLKLPAWVRREWMKKIQGIDYEDYPDFKMFADFLTKIADRTNNPIFLDMQSEQKSKTKPKVEDMKNKRTSAAACASSSTESKPKTSTMENQDNSKKKSQETKLKVNCLVCGGTHGVPECKDFEKLPLEQRREMAREKKMCFKCLSGGHMASSCPSPLICAICNKKHPSLFHRFEVAVNPVNSSHETSHKGTNAATASVKQSATHRCSMIVPVVLEYEDKAAYVYAMLDTQSDTSFVLKDVADMIGAKGQPVNLKLTTLTSQEQQIESNVICGMRVRSISSEDSCVHLPPVFTREVMPAHRSHIPTSETLKNSQLDLPAGAIGPLQDYPIGLLIGYDCPAALKPQETISSPNQDLFAMKTELGWGLVGCVNHLEGSQDPIGVSHVVKSHPVRVNQQLHFTSVVFKVSIDRSPMFTDLMKLDEDAVVSQEDLRFLQIVSKAKQLPDGHYEIPLPFSGEQQLPCNKVQAERRLEKLRVKLKRDPKYQEKYVSGMKKMFDSGHAELVPSEELADGKWYLPHHGVVQPQKPDKLRIVFDASCEFKDHSLNDNLLSGPDLLNSLVGILLRFRLEHVAIACDVREMFHQFLVPAADRNFFRFLWFSEGNIDGDVQECRMKVHLFGARSSPGCANYGMKRLTQDHSASYPQAVSEFVMHNFYVDDGLISVADFNTATSLIEGVKNLCALGCLKLHKFASNSKEVMQAIPLEDRATGSSHLPALDEIERALGVQWCLESDCFLFRITISDRPLTRRGVLSTINSVYDPLGFISPFVLRGKCLLQELTRLKFNWDDEMPDEIGIGWKKWLADLHELKRLSLPRCYKPLSFGTVHSTSYHHFADASESGFGACSYVRLVDENGMVHCSLVMARAKVAPIKTVTIPRLELMAAVDCTLIAQIIKKELCVGDVQHSFYSDSKIVLGYIRNDSKRFKTFVANRVQQIRNISEPHEWNHVSGNCNPADLASRGASPQELMSSKWLCGPDFLWEPCLEVQDTSVPEVNVEDPEVKTICLSLSTEEEDPLHRLITAAPTWSQLITRVAVWLKLRTILLKMKDKSFACPRGFSVEVLKCAERTIVQYVQKSSFKKDITLLHAIRGAEADRQKEKAHKLMLRTDSSLFRLDPFLDCENTVRIGGRLRRGVLPEAIRHPVVLPRDHRVSRLIAEHCHKQSAHQGRGITINAIRAKRYWLIGCSRIVSRLIDQCVFCRKGRARALSQKMSDLPVDRLTPSPPFSYCGMDFFGPFLIQEGRRVLKRYGVVFVCLYSKAIHIEIANSLSTDSCINAIRRLVCIRGPVRQIRSDCGSNILASAKEIGQVINQEEVQRRMSQEGCDYIMFKPNVPAASYQGGIWERQIRTIRNVLSGLLGSTVRKLDDELLRTLMAEVMAIVNNRPLSTDNLLDPTSLIPLTPNNILTAKSNIILPPPGTFDRTDGYLRKRWRHVQHLANEFWQRWKSEYIKDLQTRRKWNKSKRDLAVGDVVLLVEDDLPRSQW